MNEIQFDAVRLALQTDNKEVLKEIYEDVSARMSALTSKFVSAKDLDLRMKDVRSPLSRHIGAEMYIPKHLFEKTKKCAAIR